MIQVLQEMHKEQEPQDNNNPGTDVEMSDPVGSVKRAGKVHIDLRYESPWGVTPEKASPGSVVKGIFVETSYLGCLPFTQTVLTMGVQIRTYPNPNTNPNPNPNH
ncbi:hypothetical protein HWV62_5688 [Athelia sp. TMB]|nr:hypothetical protein HWV62_5688 [Athelia sp. TMB]